MLSQSFLLFLEQATHHVTRITFVRVGSALSPLANDPVVSAVKFTDYFARANVVAKVAAGTSGGSVTRTELLRNLTRTTP